MSFVEKMMATNLVGLDIGTDSIKFVQLKQTPKANQLIKAGSVSIPSESIGEEVDPELREALIVETVKRIFKENKINSRNVVTAVSGDAVIVRHVRLPAMSSEELKGVIQYEAEQYIPNVDQFALDFQILGETMEDNQKKMEVLLVGAKHEFIERHMKILEEAGLRSIIIDVVCLAMANAYEMNYAGQVEEGVVLLNIGSKLTTVGIMEGLNLRNTRDIYVGGSHFTRDIQREFNLSFTQAEELKKTQANIIVETDDISLLRMPSKDNRSIQIFEAIGPTLNKLVTEIRRFFDYYETLTKKRSLTKVVLSGGSTEIKNMDKFLQERLGLPVESNDAFRNIQVLKAAESDLQARASLFNVAIGLAARKV